VLVSQRPLLGKPMPHAHLAREQAIFAILENEFGTEAFDLYLS
jgi:hypothetical protein